MVPCGVSLRGPPRLLEVPPNRMLSVRPPTNPLTPLPPPPPISLYGLGPFPHLGLYDGVLGVLGGIEALAALKRAVGCPYLHACVPWMT